MQQFILVVALIFIGLTHALHSGSLPSPNILRGKNVLILYPYLYILRNEHFSYKHIQLTNAHKGTVFPKTFLPQSSNTNRITPNIIPQQRLHTNLCVNKNTTTNNAIPRIIATFAMQKTVTQTFNLS